jgi:hypothetical protein
MSTTAERKKSRPTSLTATTLWDRLNKRDFGGKFGQVIAELVEVIFLSCLRNSANSE